MVRLSREPDRPRSGSVAERCGQSGNDLPDRFDDREPNDDRDGEAVVRSRPVRQPPCIRPKRRWHAGPDPPRAPKGPTPRRGAADVALCVRRVRDASVPVVPGATHPVARDGGRLCAGRCPRRRRLRRVVADGRDASESAERCRRPRRRRRMAGSEQRRVGAHARPERAKRRHATRRCGNRATAGPLRRRAPRDPARRHGAVRPVHWRCTVVRRVR